MKDEEREGCSFEWDEKSQLYYHASSGFYHDPTAGWYYNSMDGLYYKFEDGTYVPIVSVEGDQSEIHDNVTNAPSTSNQDNLESGGTQLDLLEDDDSEAHELSIATEFPTVDPKSTGQMSEFPPPPSEWLEDTLIDLYLSGHSNRETNAVHDERMSTETGHDDGSGNDDVYELEEGEWIPDGGHNVDYPSEIVSDEDVSWDEENWRAQYGQVIYSGEKSQETHSKIVAVDLWDWALVKEPKRKRKRQVAHLVGRLVRQSTNLHPSVPSRGRLLKTAPIREVWLDLVRVRSGKIYRLKRPSAKYFVSLSIYDSSNPTKDWGFPELSCDMQIEAPSRNAGTKVVKGQPVPSDSTLLPEKNGGGAYRDRAAERRALHGGFGVGPGQKKSASDDDYETSRPVLPEEAAGEALDMSFGAGSYARKLLKNMGWKEGEALGSSSKGLIEPLQAVGNKGNAGLGWDQNGRRHV